MYGFRVKKQGTWQPEIFARKQCQYDPIRKLLNFDPNQYPQPRP
jgi:hypothetical protein